MSIKKLVTFGSILSLVSLIPIGFMINNMNELFNLLNIGSVDPKIAEQLSSRTLSTPIYLWPIIVGFIIYALSATCSALILKKNTTRLLKWYSVFLLIFGGFGIATILGIIWLSKNSNTDINKSRISNPLKKVTIIGTGALTVLPIPFIIAASSYEGFDARTYASPIVYSLDEESPNLIEIFTDGFDEDHIRPILNRISREKPTGGIQNFGDFTSFPYSVAEGFLTNMSVPALWGGDKFNPFLQKERRNSAESKDSVLDYTYKNLFTEAVVKHMHDINPDKFNKLNILNTTAMSNEAGYSKALSGDENDVRNTYKETYQLPDSSQLNIVNWAEAKHSVSGDFGVNQYNHDAVFYKWIEKNGKTQDSISYPNIKAKGTRILLQDLITHTPFTGDINGKLEWDSKDNKYERVIKTLNHYFHSLPQGVYDNSMIVIYGDHADHSRPVFDEDNNLIFKGNRTFSMVKYPNRSGTEEDYKEDRSVAMYVPYIRQLAIHYFNNPLLDIDTNEFDWIHSNSHFNKSQDFPVYSTDYETVWKAHFEDNEHETTQGIKDDNLLRRTVEGDSFKDVTFPYDSGMGWS